MLIAYSDQNSQPFLLKTAVDSGRKTATNSDMIAPGLNGSFWKKRINAIDPQETFEAFHKMSATMQ